MSVTERQGQILNKIVEEYISLAHPVSSQLLGEKYSFGIRPAMIRIEVQQLTDEGYLAQPHTSAGRVPTDKGYRFFVDNFKQKLSPFDNRRKKILQEAARNPFQFIQTISDIVAASSSNLAISYLTQDRLLWREGWADIFQEPEFKNSECASQLAKIVDIFEDSLDVLADNLPSNTQVFIGRENFIPRSDDFSMIITKKEIPCLKQETVIAVLGPRRMAYQRNISLMDSLSRIFEEL